MPHPTTNARRRRALWFAGYALLALAGCHARPSSSFSPVPGPAQLPVASRPNFEPDLSGVTAEAVPLVRPDKGRRLTAPDTRRLARANAPFAADLDRHEDNQGPNHEKLNRKAARFAAASRLVRGHAADELRNRAAGEALDEFFKLAGAEGQFDLLAAAAAELKAQLGEAERAEQAGLKDRADTPALRRQLLDVEAQQAKLEAGIGALNASLRARLGLEAGDPLPLWPIDPLAVSPDDIDVPAAVATGLVYRPDLNALRVLADGGAADLTDAVLTGLNPLLAKLKPDSPLALLLLPCVREPERQKEAATGRAASALAARTRQAEAEIRAAAVSLRGHRAAVAARALDVRAAEARVSELEQRKAAGLSVAADLAAAKLAVLKAKGERLSAVIEWHTTEVKLRQAMGLLVRE
ncbi:TolC family protein [Gemmata sp. JC717]|uniref:TolC family protein n=1 Tax=Gemmata algarum TaxID=2975278 RepID=UPI0021BB8DFB|nr:TolC family protein [Gemmata algarum]MDY3553878.1 TolC family protein [Gemmata algarum]